MDKTDIAAVKILVSYRPANQLPKLLVDLLSEYQGLGVVGPIAIITGQQLVISDTEPYVPQLARYLISSWTPERLKRYIHDFATQCSHPGTLISLVLGGNVHAFNESTTIPLFTRTVMDRKLDMLSANQLSSLVVNITIKYPADERLTTSLLIGHTSYPLDQADESPTLEQLILESIVHTSVATWPAQRLRSLAQDLVLGHPDPPSLSSIMMANDTQGDDRGRNTTSSPDPQRGEFRQEQGTDVDHWLLGLEQVVDNQDSQSEEVGSTRDIGEGPDTEDQREAEGIREEWPDETGAHRQGVLGADPLDEGLGVFEGVVDQDMKADETGSHRQSVLGEDPSNEGMGVFEGLVDQDMKVEEETGIEEGDESTSVAGGGLRYPTPGSTRTDRRGRCAIGDNGPTSTPSGSTRSKARASPANPSGETPNLVSEHRWKRIALEEIETLKVHYKSAKQPQRPATYKRLLELARWVHHRLLDYDYTYQAFASGEGRFDDSYLPMSFVDTNDLVAFLECAFALAPGCMERMGIPKVVNLRSRAHNPKVQEDGDLICSGCFCQYGLDICWWPAKEIALPRCHRQESTIAD